MGADGQRWNVTASRSSQQQAAWLLQRLEFFDQTSTFILGKGFAAWCCHVDPTRNIQYHKLYPPVRSHVTNTNIELKSIHGHQINTINTTHMKSFIKSDIFHMFFYPKSRPKSLGSNGRLKAFCLLLQAVEAFFRPHGLPAAAGHGTLAVSPSPNSVMLGLNCDL